MAQFEEFATLVGAVDQAVTDEIGASKDRMWGRVLAHLPGLAPALDVLLAHVVGCLADCTKRCARGQGRLHAGPAVKG